MLHLSALLTLRSIEELIFAMIELFYDYFIVFLFASRPQLLPRKGSSSSAIMVRQAVHDVFLCDRCDQEFNTLAEVQVSQ